ncbi:MAG: hypothetical protein JWM68_3592 [Verrucomicrobiales bacterium]|nr:hypothetical protein [Verrucomicrobiales bacterium]
MSTAVIWRADVIECSTIVRGLRLLVKLKFANPLDFPEDDTSIQF